MVKDFKDISPKELKKVKKVLSIFETLGISQNDILEIFSNVNYLVEQNQILNERVNVLEEWQARKIKEEIERAKSFQTDQQKEYRKYMNGDEEYDPFDGK